MNTNNEIMRLKKLIRDIKDQRKGKPYSLAAKEWVYELEAQIISLYGQRFSPQLGKGNIDRWYKSKYRSLVNLGAGESQ